METIKISQESLDAFKKERSLIPAPFDNKNLMEDALTDNVFENFYQAVDHYKNGRCHLIGHLRIFAGGIYIDGLVDVSWKRGTNVIIIKLLASPSCDDTTMRDDCYNFYEKIFKEWECDENEGLVVKTSRMFDNLYVKFYFEVE